MPFDSNGVATLVPGYLAVTGQTILASQHNPPLEDIASMLSQTLLRSGVAPMGGNLNASGFKIINAADGTSPQDYVTLTQLQAVIASITAAQVPVGQLSFGRWITAPAGYVLENGGTIGSATSGATTRANADTQALFTHLWNSFNNTLLPIQNSAGTATTRGASAAVDFTANKRMPLFDSRSRFVRGTDSGLGFDAGLTVGVTQGDVFKTHAHNGTTDNNSNQMTITAWRATNEQANVGVGTRVALWDNGIVQEVVSVVNNDIHNHDFTTDATGNALETRPRSTVCLACIKL